MKHTRKDYNRIQDPLNLIPENEPVFLLRAKDVLSIQLLTRYRELVEANGTDADRKTMVDNIEDCINQFRNWQASAGAEMPTLKDVKEIADIIAAYELTIAPDGKTFALTQEIEELKEIRSMFKAQYESLNARIKAVDLVVKENEALKKAIEERQNENVATEAMKEEYRKRIEALSSDNDGLRNENVSLQERFDAMVKRYDEHLKEIEKMNEEAQEE